MLVGNKIDLVQPTANVDNDNTTERMSDSDSIRSNESTQPVQSTGSIPSSCSTAFKCSIEHFRTVQNKQKQRQVRTEEAIRFAMVPHLK
ncbi:MAG: hypothetical protein MHM6MM_004247 [Cercozoa sp. M6MM]